MNQPDTPLKREKWDNNIKQILDEVKWICGKYTNQIFLHSINDYCC